LLFNGRKQTLSEGANKKTSESPITIAAKKRPMTGRNDNPAKKSITPKNIKNNPLTIFIARADEQSELNIMTPPEMKINRSLNSDSLLENNKT
jgi:hypothetical protein